MGLWKGLTSRVVLVSACCATTPLPEIHAKAHVSLNSQAGKRPRLTQLTGKQKAHVSLNSQAGKSLRLTQLTGRQKAHVSLNSQARKSPRLTQLTGRQNLTQLTGRQKPTSHSTHRQAKAHVSLNSQARKKPTSNSIQSGWGGVGGLMLSLIHI